MLNLDKTLRAHFGGTDTEISYGPSRLSPLCFQDDAAEISTGLAEAQKSNILISQAMKMKQLDINVGKLLLLFLGKRSKWTKLKNLLL